MQPSVSSDASTKLTGDAAGVSSIEMVIIFVLIAIVLFLVWKLAQRARGRSGASHRAQRTE